ncbi:MAG: tetratricopeptide repeat protein, partial [Bacteroidota bacterium]
FISLVQGDYQQAVQRSEKILSVAPEDLWSLGMAGYAHLIPGNYQVAKRYYEKAIAVSALASNPFVGRYITTDLGYISWKMGRQAEAQKLFAQSLKLLQNELEKGNESFLVRYDLASINATQGDKLEAYMWLKAAIDAGWQKYRLALVDPFFENLRNDEQFKQMMNQVKLRVEEMRKKAESL